MFDTPQSSQQEYFAAEERQVQKGTENLREIITAVLKQELAKYGFSEIEVTNIISKLDKAVPESYEAFEIISQKLGAGKSNTTSLLIDNVRAAQLQLAQLSNLDQSRQEQRRISKLGAERTPVETAVLDLSKFSDEDMEILQKFIASYRPYKIPGLPERYPTVVLNLFSSRDLDRLLEQYRTQGRSLNEEFHALFGKSKKK